MEDPEIQPQDTPEAEPAQETVHTAQQTVSIEEWKALSEAGEEEAPPREALEDAQLLAVLEACVYVAEEPVTPAQIAGALNQDPARVRALLEQLVAEFDRPEHGVSIREVAGGYKMATKPEHHEAVRNFVKSLKPALKLSLPALETLAVIAYKQPVTTPEIMEIRGVQGGGVLKTLLDRKLVTEAGRKNVIGKPILYKTTREFLIQFGLKDLSELPSLKEFEEIGRMAMAESEVAVEAPDGEAAADAAPEAATPEAEALDAPATPAVQAQTAEAPAPEAPEAPAVPAAQAETAEAPAPDAPEAPAVPAARSETPEAAIPADTLEAPAAPTVQTEIAEAAAPEAPEAPATPAAQAETAEALAPEVPAAEEPVPESQDR
jgi:segregation and condensation protein B